MFGTFCGTLSAGRGMFGCFRSVATFETLFLGA